MFESERCTSNWKTKKKKTYFNENRLVSSLRRHRCSIWLLAFVDFMALDTDFGKLMTNKMWSDDSDNEHELLCTVKTRLSLRIKMRNKNELKTSGRMGRGARVVMAALSFYIAIIKMTILFNLIIIKYNSWPNEWHVCFTELSKCRGNAALLDDSTGAKVCSLLLSYIMSTTRGYFPHIGICIVVSGTHSTNEPKRNEGTTEK